MNCVQIPQCGPHLPSTQRKSQRIRHVPEATRPKERRDRTRHKHRGSEQRTAPFADVVPLLIHKDVETRLAMWITILPGSRSGDVHATANSPALSLDRVNIARSDERLITLDINGITKTTTAESAILREDHLVFVALPSELHAYVMRKKRRLPPAFPLLLPSTKLFTAARETSPWLAKLRLGSRNFGSARETSRTDAVRYGNRRP
jgi:hypothetical protein